MEEELKLFQWHLINTVEGSTRIPKAHLKNAKIPETVDEMVERLGVCKAVEVTLDVLKKINQNQQAEELRTKYSAAIIWENPKDSGVKELCDGLKGSNCKLEKLRLSGYLITEKSCCYLASVLTSVFSSALKELDLSNNDLKDSGVQELCEGLGNSHCKLEILRLSGCLVTEKGCSYLASALSSNPSHLKELDLTYNYPGDSGMELLSARQKDPHCRLEKLRVEHAGENRIKPGLKKYACKITLDPNTAHAQLTVSKEENPNHSLPHT
ncbi:hypothetical protein AOLI_G00268480 [Acnodon oligacanthus]